jgi:hypothetical protein
MERQFLEGGKEPSMGFELARAFYMVRLQFPLDWDMLPSICSQIDPAQISISGLISPFQYWQDLSEI